MKFIHWLPTSAKVMNLLWFDDDWVLSSLGIFNYEDEEENDDKGEEPTEDKA